MTKHRDIARVLDQWLVEGSTVAPDRVVDAVAARIEREWQRPAWLASERKRNVTSNLRIAAAVAAIVILGAGAVYVASRAISPNVGGPYSPPSASPIASAPGPSLRTTSSTTFQPAVRLNLPDGWVVASDEVRTFRIISNAAGAAPAGVIEIRNRPALASSTDSCSGAADVNSGTSAATILAALASDARFTTTPAGTLSVGGRSLGAEDVALAPTWTETCTWSQGAPAAVLLTVIDPPGGYVGLAGREVIRVVLLDVGGVAVSLSFSPTNAADFDTFMSAAAPILESVAFTP